MGRGANVMQPLNRGAVIDRRRKRAPQEKLIETAKASIGVATDEVDVERLEIGRRIGPPPHDAVAETVDVGGEDRFYPVRQTFAYCLGPLPVIRHRERAR